jgi:hypothetical protein
LNNFYLREEDLELRHAFRLPPNIFDKFETAELAALRRTAPLLQRRLVEQEALVQSLEAEIRTLRSVGPAA